MDDVEVKGVGGVSRGEVFRLDRFELGRLVFPGLNVFVPRDKQISQHFIIPASMLAGLIYEINDPKHRMRVTVPDGEGLERYPYFHKDGERYVFLTQ